jgi:acyl carrier protein
MDDVREKLTACFATVFPNLDPAVIASASAGQMEEWDSLAQVNLLSVIGEEFGMDIDFEDFEDATSFEAILDRLRQRGAGA